MTWQLVHDVNHAFAESPVSIVYEFTNNLIVVRAVSAAAQPSWRRAGNLYQVINFVGIGEAEGETKQVILGTKYIEFDNFTVPFNLQFAFVPWLPSLRLQIWSKQP